MSYAFVMIYATLHTRSPFLALVGLFLVMLSIPATLAVFVLVSGSGEFSLMMPGWKIGHWPFQDPNMEG
jgi:uncharacterized RDD family membrane protein YckC